MNKKIDNVLCFSEHTLSNKIKTLCKVFSINIILYRNSLVKEFCEKILIGGFLLWKITQIY